MKKKKKTTKGKTATRNIYVCDQGHYGLTICSECGYNLEDIYDKCPGCGSVLIGKDIDYNRGGSDF